MRKLAHVEKIVDIRPIPNADKIEVATVLGWQVVIKKGEFKPGDRVVYIEIDSRVPKDNPYFAFLQDRNYKVKSIKLRKTVSQGLIVPMSLLPEGVYQDGDDVTDLLGITKIEEDYVQPKVSKEVQLKQRHKKLTQNKVFQWFMKFGWFRKIAFKTLIPKKKKKNWPDWIIRTDEPRCQNLPWILENKAPFIVSEKLDGTSSTFSLHKEGRKWKFYVCSRNVVQDTPEKRSYLNDVNGIEGNTYWEMAEKYNIEQALILLKDKLGAREYVTLQGETVGEGIQKNKYNFKGHDIFFFNLIVDGNKIDSVSASRILEAIYYDNHELFDEKFRWVPIIATDYVLPDTFEELMEYSTGKSSLEDTLREGYVFRNYEEGISFKCVSNEFLLKWKI